LSKKDLKVSAGLHGFAAMLGPVLKLEAVQVSPAVPTDAVTSLKMVGFGTHLKVAGESSVIC
jgi:hypothetical protein